MENLNTSFWIGISAAIPLSIAANLLTPWIQQLLAKRSATRAAERSKQLREELESIEKLTVEPGRLQTFLLESVLLITLLTSAFGVFAGFFFAMANVFGASEIFASMGQLVAIVGGVLVMKECLSALRKSQNARNSEKFRERVQAQLKELE